MSVSGFPDARRHRFCFRCRRWFEPDEGVMVSDGRWRPLDWVRVRIDIPTETRDLFVCSGCRKFGRAVKTIVVALIVCAIVAGAAYAFVDVLSSMGDGPMRVPR